jgi:lysophospholipase L1-like esterase
MRSSTSNSKSLPGGVPAEEIAGERSSVRDGGTGKRTRAWFGVEDRPLTVIQPEKLIPQLIKLGVILAVGVVALEIAMRLAGIAFPDFGLPDQDRGWELRPNAEGWVRAENKVGVYVKINSQGLRDREHSIAKPPGTFRVAVLGNSYTEAFQVSLEQTYWAVLERELGRCGVAGTRKVEVINFGVSGYGTAQELITLRTQVWQYEPDVVLLAFLTGNDIWYNHRALYQEPLSPYFVYQDNKLALDDSFRQLIKLGALRGFQAEVEKRSRVAQALFQAHNQFKQWMFDLRQSLKMAARKDQGDLIAATMASDAVETKPTDMVYVPPRDATWSEAWRVTEGLIRLMRDEVVSHGAQFWVATLSNSPQVHPDPEERNKLARALGTQDLFYPDRRIQAFAERERIPLTPLAFAFGEYATRNKSFLHGFPGHMGAGHWNEEGNRLAGEIIARGMCRGLRR